MSEKIINSDQSYRDVESWMFKEYQEHKYLRVSVRTGKDRGLGQNALLHVWLTEYAAHLLKKDKKSVTPGEVEGMKLAAKRKFFKEYREDWMIQTEVDPFTKEEKTGPTSSANWSHEQMFTFLTWLQGFAATEDGLMLKSKGKFKDEQEKHKEA